jgi:DNA-binding NarL/FixJ family response regulator
MVGKYRIGTILELLAIGERYDSVAQRLSLNERTVRRSYESVAKKLNAATPFEVAYKAVKRGWL